MLHRIIRAIFLGIPFIGIVLCANHFGEQSLLPQYYASNSEYQNYLSEVENLSQASFGSGQKSTKSLKPRQIAEILRQHLDSDEWSEAQIQELAKHIWQLSYRYEFNPLLIISLIDVESQFAPTAVSDRGAVGLLQVMPTTAAQLKSGAGADTLRDPLKNLELGVRYMVELRKKFKKPRQYLTAYNIGPGALRRKLKQGQKPSDVYLNKVMRSYHDAEVLANAL